MHEISQVHTFSKRLPFFFCTEHLFAFKPHRWVFNLDRKEEEKTRAVWGSFVNLTLWW